MKIPLQQIIRFHGFPVCLCDPIRLSLWPMAQADLIHNPVYGPLTGDIYSLQSVKAQLDNLYEQQAAAKEESGKPFPYEEELRVKSDRLVELDTLLNMDGKGRAQPETVIAKSARPSVLDSLKRPIPPRNPEKKPKQHEQEVR